MTTFAQLKAALKLDLRDPDSLVFDGTALGDMLNAGIAAVSRVAPQRFTEDITLVEGETRYRLHGGTGNLVANGSFEEGDATIIGNGPALVTVADSVDLLGGWLLSADAKVGEPKNANRKTGLYVGSLQRVAGTNVQLSQDVPVNPSTVYAFSGWHWKGVAGGTVNRIAVYTLDSDSVLVDTIYTHDTTAAAPVKAGGTVSVPSSGVAYIRIALIAVGTPATSEVFDFEDITVIEQSELSLVSDTAIPEIEVSRVEVWNGSSQPERYVKRIAPAAAGWVNSSAAGWHIWGGYLELPNWLLDSVDVSYHFVRVWGYAPYDRLTTDAQITDLTDELEWAVRLYARLDAVGRLLRERELFTQWQTRAAATDVSPAALMNSYSLLRADWERAKKELFVLRELG